MKYATFLTCFALALGNRLALSATLVPSADDGDTTIETLPPGYVEPAPLFPNFGTRGSAGNSGSGYYGSSSGTGAGNGGIEKVQQGVSIVRDLINLGKEAWSLVENSKPSITLDEPFDSHAASAVPAGLKHFSEMSYWKGPATKVYTIRWKAMGVEYASFSYRITYQYAGKYKGAGRYLKNVTVIPEEIHIPWGYNFNSSVSVVDPINYGSETDPLAGLQVIVRYSLANSFGKQESRRTHVVRGDGALLELK